MIKNAGFKFFIIIKYQEIYALQIISLVLLFMHGLRKINKYLFYIR